MTFTLFPSFLRDPASIRFEQQEEDEHVILFLRQHWITNVGWMITALLLTLFPVVLVFLTAYAVFQLPFVFPVRIAQAALLLWYMLILAYILEKFLGWYYNIYIVSDKHIVDIDFHSLLSRQVIQSQLEDVQNVSTHIKGIFASLFNYGDVKIRTSAEHQVFDFVSVPHPDIVADIIQDLQPSMTSGGPA